jgi:NAD-dependent deacetylase
LDVTSSLKTVAGWLAEARHAVAFTGAGVSTESGIPDYRSPNGVWARTQPVLFDEFLRSPDARLEYWRQKAQSHVEIHAAQPNVTHLALANWELSGRLRGVITQNIDGLHRAAGSRQVLELHGTAREIACLRCDWRCDADPMVREFNATGVVPHCPRCLGVLKHATISFGQSLSAEVLGAAMRWSREADLFLVLGSSLVVEPAASLPRIAKESGARLVIVNRERTPLDSLADCALCAALGETVSQLKTLVEARSNSNVASA